jgi:hypothetical protein
MLGLAGAAIAFEFVTRAHTLTEQDSINLANALRDFNPADDRPHPPGYPLVVGAAHALHWFFTPLGAYLALDLVATLAALASTYWLARSMFGPRAGIVAPLLLCSTPLVLYYADIVSVYPPEMALTPVVALLAFRVATNADRFSPMLLFPALALAAGFRPTTLGLMLPTCLVAIALGRPPLRPVLEGALAAAVIVCAWGVPTIVESGGLHPYLRRSHELYGQASSGSILHGGTPGNAAYNVWFTAAATVLTALPALILVVIFLSRSRWARPRAVGAQWWILLTWFASYFVFYAVVLLGKPGYLLAYVPAVDVAAAGLVARWKAALPVATLIAIGGVVGYLAIDVWPLPSAFSQRKLAQYLPTEDAVTTQDRETRGLERFAPSCRPPACTIVSLAGSRRFFFHDVDSLHRRYAPDARIAVWKDVVAGSSPAPRGRALWIGTQVPVQVMEKATLVGRAGTWRFYESTPAQTAAIIGSALR